MKKIIILSLILLLMLPLVLANSYDLELQEGTLNAITLEEKDEVRFELLGATHSLYVKSIGRDGDVKISLIPFLDTEKQSYGFLYFGMSLETDLDQDGENDLAIGLLKFKDDGRVVIGLQDADARKLTDTGITGDVGLIPSEDLKKNYSIVYVIAALVLGIVGVLLVVNKPKKNEKPVEESDDSILDDEDEEKSSEDEFNTEEE
ncbi:MAG: integrin alpha [archaeon]